MISCCSGDFFATPPGASPLSQLAGEDEPVWRALDSLRAFLETNIRPNVSEIAEPGVPLERHVALLPGGVLRDGFEVRCSPGGRLEIWIEGELVKTASLVCAGAVFADTDVEIGSGVLIEPHSFIKGPTLIKDNTDVRQGAYIRGSCLIGKGCVVGHTTEVKNSIFMDGAKAGHFAYIGDSILGRDVNLGAGTKLANLRFDGANVVVRLGNEHVDTGRRKLGAILGDGVQTGCNSVTNPGVLIGRGSFVSPNTSVRPGCYGPGMVI